MAIIILANNRRKKRLENICLAYKMLKLHVKKSRLQEIIFIFKKWKKICTNSYVQYYCNSKKNLNNRKIMNNRYTFVGWLLESKILEINDFENFRSINNLKKSVLRTS